MNEVVITNNSYEELPGGAQSRLKMFFSITVTAVSKYVILSPGKIQCWLPPCDIFLNFDVCLVEFLQFKTCPHA